MSVQHGRMVEPGGHGVCVRMAQTRRNLAGQRHIEHVLSKTLHFSSGVVVFPFVIVIAESAVLCFPPAFDRLGGVVGGRGCDPCGIRFSSYVFRVRQFVIFLPFHTAVLEPYFDLSLGEDEGVGDFDSSSAG